MISSFSDSDLGAKVEIESRNLSFWSVSVSRFPAALEEEREKVRISVSGQFRVLGFRRPRGRERELSFWSVSVSQFPAALEEEREGEE